jgi:hypothetical protein
MLNCIGIEEDSMHRFLAFLSSVISFSAFLKGARCPVKTSFLWLGRQAAAKAVLSIN